MTGTDKHILLAKWLEGTISDKELERLKEQGDLTDLEAAVSRLEAYDLGSIDEDTLWKSLSKKREKSRSKIRYLFPKILGLAASILLVIGSFWWWNNQATVVIAENGAQKEVILPNHSVVKLNAGSKLTYYENNWKKIRKLTLKGEAFFKVTKGVPFEVESKNGIVTVLGTQFNIFSRENTFKVVCFEGSVKVEAKDTPFETILTKGKGVVIDNNTTPIEENATSPSWLSGIITFDKATLKQIFEELERQFDIKIEPVHVDLNRRFTGEISSIDLKRALDKLCGAMNLAYQIPQKGKKVIISREK